LVYARDDDDPSWTPVARYARGRDYHDVMRPRLVELGEFIARAAGADVRCRAAVDTSAVLERDLAARAGLGWIGKNTNLLAPSLGSWFFIGVVLTTARLEWDAREPDRCGTCTACLDACPTQAFVGPYALDARRCIAYLTIEHRDDIPEAYREAIGEWVFGCDVCQDVCPWNRKAARAREPAFAPAAPLGPLEALLDLDREGFHARFRGSAMWRAKRSGLRRNAALVLGNRRDRRGLPARPLASALERALRQPVVVSNKAGAAGAVGMQSVAIAKADGYTLMVAVVSISTLPEVDALFGRAPAYRRNQFVGIARLNADPPVLVVGTEWRWRTLKELVEEARKRPGEITYASSGLYGASHVPMEMLLHAAGIRMRHLPTTGGGPATTAVLGGHAALWASPPAIALPHLKSGKLRALATWGESRVAALPDV